MSKIIKNQEEFFNRESHTVKAVLLDDLFYNYVNKEQFAGLDWISDRKVILDYGCGTGHTMDIFFSKRSAKNYKMYGVDIAGETIKVISKNYPKFNFYQIKHNKVPQIKDNSIEGVYMMHVLHHAKNHEEIFKEIHKKLKKGGKFLVNDLCSNNPINFAARSLFTAMPESIKNKFGDDLMVDGCIPEKYKVVVPEVVKALENTGFKVTKVSYGHLFFFVFGWIDRFIPFSKVGIIRSFYKKMINWENVLLKKSLYQGKAELFCIQAIKK